MTELTIEEFYHDLRQDTLAGSETNQDFLECEYLQGLAKELEDSGVIEGFEPCHYKAPKGMRADGYWFKEDEGVLELFILDFSNRVSLESLTRTEVLSTFKKLENFFVASIDKKLYEGLEETSPGYGLSRYISDRQGSFSKINLYLISERVLSERIQTLDDAVHKHWTFTYHIWDISRFHRLATSLGAKEDLIVDFIELYGNGLQCLPAHLNNADYESYLLVIPGEILSDLYGKYGSRLLEQNVRCFLQARGKINKGIRATIMNDPGMFFAYNNGITATAKEVITEKTDKGIYIKQIRDLQVVNGGQTTASLFHANRKDKVLLDQVFVPMKLSIVNEEKSEEVVPKISEFANTQNRVNAADFFSNHPFHVRMEEFSRRILAPPQQGVLRETRWFYERARGQYSDAQSKMTIAERKKFQAMFPKPQMFTKTDLAKFENVWDEKPTFVNLGAEKNFTKYAERIGKEWEKNPDKFGEFYYKCSIARAIIFKRAVKIIPSQSWYQGDYRAQLVAYTLAMLSEYCMMHNKSVDPKKIWNKQDISPAFIQTIGLVGKLVSDDIIQPPEGISNIGEWCKKDACWTRLKEKMGELKRLLPEEFNSELIPIEKIMEGIKDSSKDQKIDDGIQAQTQVLEFSGSQWRSVLDIGKRKGIFTPKEIGILEVASRIPEKIPSEKQSVVLLDILEKARLEGIKIS